MLLGTNVLRDLRFCIINNDRSKLIPERVAKPSKQCEQSNGGNLSLAKPSEPGEAQINANHHTSD